MNEAETILLVDDSENDLFLVRRAFEEAKFNNPLQEVHNGKEAIAYLKGDDAYRDRIKFPFPVVMMMDLNMPMNGTYQLDRPARTGPEPTVTDSAQLVAIRDQAAS